MKKKATFLSVSVLFWSLVLFTAAQRTHPNEVKALDKIRKSLGDSFGKLNSWNHGDPCNSKWIGVICHGNASADGYFHVIQLELLNLNLSGSLAPEIGQLQQLTILDFMWNKISGTIPKAIGNITTLKLLLLNGNNLSGSLPEEIGYLSNLDRIQIDENNISGPLPKSIANLSALKHLHMNNNSISGEIPKEISRLSNLVHILLDNNNLTGKLPSDLWKIPNLHIVQLDNNHFTGSQIPSSYTKISKLYKLSLRNCGLLGSIPDFSSIPHLMVLDLSHNNLTGKIPSSALSVNITTIDLSHNNLNGSIPKSFAALPQLQRLSLDNNQLSGAVPDGIGLNIKFGSNTTLFLDFQNNNLTNVNASKIAAIPNITMWLQGNPVCSQNSQSRIAELCCTQKRIEDTCGSTNNSFTKCRPNSCTAPYYEYIPDTDCFCVVPFEIGMRLKSPSFSQFPHYRKRFDEYMASGLNLSLYQFSVITYIWEPGPRLSMNTKFFPPKIDRVYLFNESEIQRIRKKFAEWKIPDSEIFGPREWINITLEGPYARLEYLLSFTEPIMSMIHYTDMDHPCLGEVYNGIDSMIEKMKLIINEKEQDPEETFFREVQTICVERWNKMTTPLHLLAFALTPKFYSDEILAMPSRVPPYRDPKVSDGCRKAFTKLFPDREMEDLITSEFADFVASNGQSASALRDKYKKDAHAWWYLNGHTSPHLQTLAIKLLSQMLVYEYMPNGSLREHLSASSKKPLNFVQRLRIALGAARGILYLHNEANPPIFHRDIKASNILLDHKFNARVADFGLSKLAPLPDLEGSAPGHVSTVVKGTPGYLDPEYFLTHKLTDKSDVYSFGVVLLELLTAMHPIQHGKNIVREVKMANESGMILSVIDQRMGSYPIECLEPFTNLALSCCKDETDARPSMAEVVHKLEKILQFTPGLDTTPMESGEMDALAENMPLSVEMTSQNPYVSSSILGSELVSGTIPEIVPR